MKSRHIISAILLFLAPVIFCHADEIDLTSSSFVYPAYSNTISMDFQEAALVNVLKIFSQQSDLNLVTAESISNRKVTVFLDNVPVEQALEQILRANELTYEIQPDSDIYIVKPLLKPAVELITRIYELKHATVKSSVINNTLDISPANCGGEKIESEIDFEEYGLKAAIEAILTEDGKLTEDARTNKIIVTDIASNFKNIETVISKLDTPAPQVLIEVEMLEVSEATADLIGNKIGNTPVVLSGTAKDTIFPFTYPAECAWEFEPEYALGSSNFSGLTATLQFLRTQTDTKSLARPTILTLSNQAAQIKISTDEAIGVKTSSISSEGLATSSVEAERVETGVFLTVTPQVNIYTGEILMALVPKVIIARTGGTFGGQTFKDPEERGTQSLLRVQSGDTIIIGGLLRTEESDTVTKMPLLGDIPLLGALFRHKDKSISDRELIIFITPHIVHETPVRKIANLPMPHLMREQYIPIEKLSEVDKELTLIEKQKL